MGLLDQARADIVQITSDLAGFAVELTFFAPVSAAEPVYDDTYDETYGAADGGILSITVNGLHSKHHMAIDSENGRPVNSRNAHVSFAEALMVGYPLRNSDGEVTLKKHKVRVKDSTGRSVMYSIRTWHPDETVGLITCILGDFKES